MSSRPQTWPERPPSAQPFIADRSDEPFVRWLGELIPAWPAVFDEAICRDTDPDVFFPDRGANGSWRTLRDVCRACPARRECLQRGLGERSGVYGGLSQKARLRLRNDGFVEADGEEFCYDRASGEVAIVARPSRFPSRREARRALVDLAARGAKESRAADEAVPCDQGAA